MRCRRCHEELSGASLNSVKNGTAMIKIAGTIPVKTRIPPSAWLLAALVTIFSLVSPIMHVGARSGPWLSQHERQTGQKSEEGSLRYLLAHLADVLTSPG